VGDMMHGFLADLNRWLVFLENELELEREDCRIEYPFVFVVGAPRSGTTVLTQVLAHCLDVGYICNLAARFWQAPIVGIRLAREILGESMSPGFNSRYAITDGAAGVHEFGYFWRHWLHMRSNTDVAGISRWALNLEGLRCALANIQAEFNKPVVMKGVWPAYIHRQIWGTLAHKVVWVNIERDPVDNCISILEGRRKRGSVEDWCCGWVPPEPTFSELSRLDPFGQIAGQVTYWRGYYAGIATHTVRLADLCADPMAVVRQVRGEIPIIRFMPYGALELREGIGSPEDRARFEELLT